MSKAKSNSKPAVAEASAPTPRKKRTYVSQADVPAFTLTDALRVPQALADSFAKQPTKPLHVANALGLTPSSSYFRGLTGASQAYGMTEGAAFADLISLTDLGRRIVAPKVEGDEWLARRDALLSPRIVQEFLRRYNNSKLPAERIATNVLEEMGVGADVSARVFGLILNSARDVGVLTDVKGSLYVDLDGGVTRPSTSPGPRIEEATSDVAPDQAEAEAHRSEEPSEFGATPHLSPPSLKANRRVFITHGKNQEIVQQLKELLHFGDFDPVVAVEHETTSKPVPKKVLDDMRTCSAAIIHVGSEQKLLDSSGTEHVILNQNVLIEIGAAMALYGDRFILLVEKGVTLPSNLQGLYEVRHEGDKLDYESTVKLLKAFNEFKSEVKGKG